jgi:hypothetical protein
MASRKKNPIPQANDIPGNQISIIPPAKPAATANSMLPVLLNGPMTPTNGLFVDNNAAVSYIASNRRRQLRAAKDKCENTRKVLNTRLSSAQPELKKACVAQAKKEQSEWIKTLNATFVKTKTQLCALVSFDGDFKVSDDKAFTYTRKLKSGTSVKEEVEAEDNGRYHHSGGVWSEAVTTKANADVQKILTQIKKLSDTVTEISDIEVKIQREINELQYSAMETQAAIFKQAMTSDASGQGKQLLDTLDERLAGMNPIPEIPDIPA